MLGMLFLHRPTKYGVTWMKEEFEDTKGVIRIRISKNNLQHNVFRRLLYEKVNEDIPQQNKKQTKNSQFPLPVELTLKVKKIYESVSL